MNTLIPLILTLAAVLAAMLTLLLACVWLVSGRVLAKKTPDPACTPRDLGLPAEAVSFSSRDGLRLSGWYTRGGPGTVMRPVVVFCPGLFGSLDGDTEMVPVFTSAGLDVLQFDWRAHGGSAGTRCTLGL